MAYREGAFVLPVSLRGGRLSVTSVDGAPGLGIVAIAERGGMQILSGSLVR